MPDLMNESFLFRILKGFGKPLSALVQSGGAAAKEIVHLDIAFRSGKDPYRIHRPAHGSQAVGDDPAGITHVEGHGHIHTGRREVDHILQFLRRSSHQSGHKFIGIYAGIQKSAAGRFLFPYPGILQPFRHRETERRADHSQFSDPAFFQPRDDLLISRLRTSPEAFHDQHILFLRQRHDFFRVFGMDKERFLTQNGFACQDRHFCQVGMRVVDCRDIDCLDGRISQQRFVALESLPAIFAGKFLISRALSRNVWQYCHIREFQIESFYPPI